MDGWHMQQSNSTTTAPSDDMHAISIIIWYNKAGHNKCIYDHWIVVKVWPCHIYRCNQQIYSQKKQYWKKKNIDCCLFFNDRTMLTCLIVDIYVCVCLLSLSYSFPFLNMLLVKRQNNKYTCILYKEQIISLIMGQLFCGSHRRSISYFCCCCCCFCFVLIIL